MSKFKVGDVVRLVRNVKNYPPDAQTAELTLLSKTSVSLAGKVYIDGWTGTCEKHITYASPTQWLRTGDIQLAKYYNSPVMCALRGK